jgi:oxygen-independent coproporphyrinogen-3 oxidase
VVEQGTALARQVAAGVVPAPEDDVLADRYVLADELLTAEGYRWYEVSNWARSEQGRCRHNELYWSDHNWWGIGPGAHSHVSGVRWWNVKHPSRYTAMVETGTSPAAGRESLDSSARHTERVMLAVRMRDGLPLAELTEAGRASVPQLASWGLVDHAGIAVDRVVLTQRGRLMADAVVRELLP